LLTNIEWFNTYKIKTRLDSEKKLVSFSQAQQPKKSTNNNRFCNTLTSEHSEKDLEMFLVDLELQMLLSDCRA